MHKDVDYIWYNVGNVNNTCQRDIIYNSMFKNKL
jgi:hypothetical protein